MVHFDRVLHLGSLAKQLGPHIQSNIALNGESRTGWVFSPILPTRILGSFEATITLAILASYYCHALCSSD
jgi:hypothetical protein